MTTILEINYKQLVLNIIREKTSSLVIGFLIVSTSFVLFITQATTIILSSNKTKSISTETVKTKTYTVKEGDSLWIIAEKMYGSGFNAVDIAKANNITEPDMLEENNQIIIPMVSPRKATQGEIATAAMTKQVKGKGTKYTVKEGDDLWKIATEMYGDGNMIYRIIQANNIVNPDTLIAGTVLAIPR